MAMNCMNKNNNNSSNNIISNSNTNNNNIIIIINNITFSEPNDTYTCFSKKHSP